MGDIISTETRTSDVQISLGTLVGDPNLVLDGFKLWCLEPGLLSNPCCLPTFELVLWNLVKFISEGKISQMRIISIWSQGPGGLWQVNPAPRPQGLA